MRQKVYAIIVAAGKGLRMGGEVRKQYLMLQGRPVIAQTLAVFDSIDLLDGIIMVIGNGQGEYVQEIMDKYEIKKNVILTEGGRERQESVYRGLTKLPKDTDIVIIHDAVRPLVTSDIIIESIKAAGEYGAAVVGVSVKDTIRQVDPRQFSTGTLDRSRLWMVQTPQSFRYEVIMAAHDQARYAGYVGTDDGVLVERMGQAVKMVEGSYDNIKITTWEDMVVAEQLLGKRVSK